MPGRPWWVQHVNALPTASQLPGLALGALWRLREQLAFVRDNVDPAHLPEDFARVPEARASWEALEALEPRVAQNLAERAEALADSMRRGAVGPEAFRTAWTELGLASHPESGGTPADDFLDGAFNVSLLTLGEGRAAFALPNMSSRAGRLRDFLSATRPGPSDVVFDLGSGNGKVALTVAASTPAQVRGVELGESYVEAARSTATRFGLANVTFLHADVRDVDLSSGSIFYLFYPFHGSVAHDVATTLGALARQKPITLYAAGPRNDFGEYFLAQVEQGALALAGEHGEFGEALLLRSPSSA